MTDTTQAIIDLADILLKERCQAYEAKDPDFSNYLWRDTRRYQVIEWIADTKRPWQFHPGMPWEPTFRALIELRDKIAFERYLESLP